MCVCNSCTCIYNKRARVCECVYERAASEGRAALARVRRRCHLYELPPPPPVVRVCAFVCARTDSVSRPECGGGGGGTTPPAHVLYRCRHRCGGSPCTCAQGSSRRARRVQGFARNRGYRAVAGALPSARYPSAVIAGPWPSPDWFSTHTECCFARRVTSVCVVRVRVFVCARARIN